ncbi:unnamed protein product [Lactuca saligna]|uniref:Uncharacterized protein n=1 Tax=Lactuca saligna TaxID=75948 RepID=A0AA35V222_LACSI|nr:unnamed protein product [Lactuca saligna]
MMHEEPNIVRPSYEARSSSDPGGSSTPQAVHDVAYEWLSMYLACEGDDHAPRGKGILIGAGSPDKEDPMMLKLKEEIGILNQKLIEKDVLIGTLDFRVSELDK